VACARAFDRHHQLEWHRAGLDRVHPFGAVRAAASTSRASATNPFRFTALDPLGPAVGDPYVSAYAYVNYNPIRHLPTIHADSR
jgi:hypothetical protein